MPGVAIIIRNYKPLVQLWLQRSRIYRKKIGKLSFKKKRIEMCRSLHTQIK